MHALNLCGSGFEMDVDAMPHGRTAKPCRQLPGEIQRRVSPVSPRHGPLSRWMPCSSATPHRSDASELVALVQLAAQCEEAPHWGTTKLVYFIDETQKNIAACGCRRH